MKYYAGIGSRETPEELRPLIVSLAEQLSLEGFTLRSGAAPGADTFFEEGAGVDKEIYLPWPDFRGRKDGYTWNTIPLMDKADKLAEKFHPAYANLNVGARLLMRRNGYQILGWDLASPSHFIACWTPDGKDVGGTSQAIRIARAYSIPVFNLGTGDPQAVVKDIIDFVELG